MDIRRKAGPVASRPFTRSSVKPRLLFPSEAQRREREEEADEEALTDIEMPHPAAARKKSLLVTPTKSKFGDAVVTPPPSTAGVRGKKNGGAGAAELQLQVELEDAVAAAGVGVGVGGEVKRKRGAFDGFQRRKAGVVGAAPGKGTKREGSPGLSGEGAAKRTRAGGAHS